MTVTVPLPQGGYPVHIQPGALRQTGALLAPLGIDRWAVTADETVAALYGGAVLDDVRRDLAEIEKESAAVTLADCRTGFFGTLYSAVLRLVAPLC